MDSDRDIQAIIDDPATSYWLSDALKAALKRDPLNAALDAEVLAIILAKRADEHAAHALAWMVVQRVQGDVELSLVLQWFCRNE